jgi:hypothetical protein
MRKLIFALAAAGTALAVATPAAAQYAQHRPYGNAYGYNHNRGQLRALEVRINAVQQQIRRLDRRNVIRDDPADRLRAEANDIEQRLHRNSRNGLNPYEVSRIEQRIVRLEQRVQLVVNRDRRRRY